MSFLAGHRWGRGSTEGASPGDEELDAVHGEVVTEALGQSVGLRRPIGLRGVGAPGTRQEVMVLIGFPLSDGGLTGTGAVDGVCWWNSIGRTVCGGRVDPH